MVDIGTLVVSKRGFVVVVRICGVVDFGGSVVTIFGEFGFGVIVVIL